MQYSLLKIVLTLVVVDIHAVPLHFSTGSVHHHRSEESYSLTYTEGLPMYRAPSGAERLVEFGTTCTAVVLQQGRLLVGNAGDSGAVLGRCLTRHLQ
jgi:hypothetical protein